MTSGARYRYRLRRMRRASLFQRASATIATSHSDWILVRGSGAAYRNGRRRPSNHVPIGIGAYRGCSGRETVHQPHAWGQQRPRSAAASCAAAIAIRPREARHRRPAAAPAPRCGMRLRSTVRTASCQARFRRAAPASRAETAKGYRR